MGSARLLVAAMCLLSSLPALAQSEPVIERVEPTSGPPGTVLNVIGRRFGAGAMVQLGEQTLELVDQLPNRLSARVPAGAASGHVAVVSQTGRVRGPEFRVTPPPPPPSIEAMDPVKGPPGTQVVLRGKHFSPRLTGNVVTFAGQPVIVRAAMPQELRVTVPEAEGAGAFTVRVEQAGQTSSPRFEITASTTITAVEPPRAGPGAQITIRGRGFSKTPASNRVYLNNAPLTVKSATESEIVALLPAKAASGKLLVDVQGAGRAFSAEAFTIQRPPTLKDFAPKKGPPGTVVTVRGTNFGNDPAAIEAKLGEAPLVVRLARDTSIDLLIPEGARDEKLSIRVHGVGPVWSNAPFVVMAPLALTSFSPQSGAPGSELVIEGQGFGDVPARNRVKIGAQIARVIEANPNRLKVRVPAGKSGPLTIEVPGSGSVRSSAPFVITNPPQVTRVIPMGGPVGTELRIEGKGFGSSASVLKVSLGGQPMAVTSVTDGLATVVVPPGAKSGRIKVAIPLEGSVELDWEFKVTEGVAPAAAANSAAATK